MDAYLRTSTVDPGRAPGRFGPDDPGWQGGPSHTAGYGFASVTIELPGSGDRPRSAAAGQARADLRRALEAGEPVADEIVDALVLPLVDRAVPEWQATLDAVLSLPEICGPVGFSGGVIAIGIRLALVEPRIAAALLFAGSFVPRTMFEEARQVTIPLQVLLQWDDERERPADGAGPVRRFRLPGEDAARQSRRAHRRPSVRGGRLRPVLRPASELAGGRPYRHAGSGRQAGSASMHPLTHGRVRSSVARR